MMCECGCGARAPVARRTNKRLGHVVGEPVRFVVGHHRRKSLPGALLRICGTCSIEKPLDGGSFKVNPKCTDGFTYECLECCRKRARESWPEIPQDARRTERRKQGLRMYGVTPEAFDAQSAKQGHKCAVCGRPFSDFSKEPAVDHDHDCCPKGQACEKCRRGLLCAPCNTALGSFQDSVLRLGSAIQYLNNGGVWK